MQRESYVLFFRDWLSSLGHPVLQGHHCTWSCSDSALGAAHRSRRQPCRGPCREWHLRLEVGTWIFWRFKKIVVRCGVMVRTGGRGLLWGSGRWAPIQASCHWLCLSLSALTECLPCTSLPVRHRSPAAAQHGAEYSPNASLERGLR